MCHIFCLRLFTLESHADVCISVTLLLTGYLNILPPWSISSPRDLDSFVFSYTLSYTWQSSVSLSICVLSTNPSLGQDWCPSSGCPTVCSWPILCGCWMSWVFVFAFIYDFLTHPLTVTISIFPIPLFCYHSETHCTHQCLSLLQYLMTC